MKVTNYCITKNCGKLIINKTRASKYCEECMNIRRELSIKLAGIKQYFKNWYSKYMFELRYEIKQKQKEMR